MIAQNIKDTRELLIDVNPSNIHSTLCNEAGFLYRFYEFNEDISVNNIKLSSDEMVELGDEKLLSLYEYGYTINGSDSERTPPSKEVLFVECSEDPSSIVSALKSVTPSLSQNILNILVMFFDDKVEPVYNSELYRIAEEFVDTYSDCKIRIYTLDLVNEVTSYKYVAKSLSQSGYLDFSTIYHPVSNDNDLDELESKVQDNGKYFISTELSSNMLDKDIWILGYIALRKSAVLVFEDSSFDNTYNLVCQRLFSHEWGMLSDVIKHVASLEGKNYIIQTDSNKFKPCTVVKVEKNYEFSVIALKSLCNNVPSTILRHTVKKKDMIVSVDSIFDSSLVMQKIWTMCNKDITMYLKMLRRIQLICLYSLTNRLIGINQICWILNNGEIYFGVPAIKYTDVEVKIYTGNDERTITTNQAKLLPISLFADDFFGVTIEGAGESTIKKLNYDCLTNIEKSRYEGSKNFTLCMNEGKIYEAFTLLNYDVSDQDNELYSRCLNMFGREICDKLSIELDGKIECYVNLSSIL